MVYLLKLVSDMVQSPQPISPFHICPKPKVKLGPTDLIHSVPPSLLDIVNARNPNQFGLTDRIPVSPRWPCKLSIACCNYFGLTKMCNRSHWVCLTNSLFAHCRNRSHQVHAISHTEMRFCPNPSASVPPRILTFTFWTELVPPSSPIRSDRVGSIVCNG